MSNDIPRCRMLMIAAIQVFEGLAVLFSLAYYRPSWTLKYTLGRALDTAKRKNNE